VGVLVAAVLIAPQLLVFLADARLPDSRRAAAGGDAAAATSAALTQGVWNDHVRGEEEEADGDDLLGALLGVDSVSADGSRP